MPGLARITFHVQDPEGFPIAATKIDAESPNGAWHATTGSDGDFTAFLAAGHYDIAFSHPGYLTRELPADLGDAGTITVGLDRAGSNTGNVHLEIRGQDFLDQAGNRTVLNGVESSLMALTSRRCSQKPNASISTSGGCSSWAARHKTACSTSIPRTPECMRRCARSLTS